MHSKRAPIIPISAFRRILLLLGFVFWLGCNVGVAKASWIDGTTAQLQALDKITARISTLSAPIGATIRFGTLEITVRKCAFRPPEAPPENVAFIEVSDRGYDEDGLGNQVFSGWMFSSSPAVSALEHPVYDVTLLNCIIKTLN
jgi:hypothetical protein